MIEKYTENHHLVSDEEGTNVHVALHLQGVTLTQAIAFTGAVLKTARGHALGAEPVRPQTSGPCVHLGKIDDDDPEEVKAIGLACRHPAGECLHLDNSDIVCPVRDACYAMGDTIRMRDECEAEQDEQDADMEAEILLCPVCDGDGSTDSWGLVEKYSLCGGSGAVTPERCEEYHKEMDTDVIGTPPADGPDADPESAYTGRLHTYVVEPEPEFPDPEPEEEPVYQARQANAWTAAEEESMIAASTPAEAVSLYRTAYPDSVRTDAAIKTRYYARVQPRQKPSPAPDFVGDEVPVTQSDAPVFLPGARVRIKHALHRGQTGEIRRYFPATENYLVAIDGMPDMIVLRDEEMEAV